MINGSGASLFGVLLLLILVCLIALPAYLGRALLAGLIYAILAPYGSMKSLVLSWSATGEVGGIPVHY